MAPSSQSNDPHQQQSQDLQETRDLLLASLDSSRDMIQVFEAVRDQQRKIIDFTWTLNNQAAHTFYGDVIGKSLLERQPGVVEEGIFAAFKHVVETGQPQQYEKHYRHEQFDGWFHQSVVKLGDGVATATADITPRKQAEQELKTTQALLQATLDSSLYVVQAFQAVRDQSGKIVDFTWLFTNQRWKEKYGPDMTGKRMLQENPAVLETGLFDHFVAVTETGVPHEHEHYYPHEQFDAWFHQTEVKMGDGFVMNAIDITDRKKAEQEILRLNEEVAKRATDKYYTLFNSIDEGFCTIEILYDQTGTAIDFRYLEVNEVYRRETGQQNPSGKLGSEVTPNNEPVWLQTYATIARTGDPLRFEQYHQDTERWYHTYASRVGGAHSHHVAIVFTDITERKRRERGRELLISIAQDLGQLTDETEIVRTVGARLAAYLGLTCYHYVDIDEDRDQVTVRHFWHALQVPPILGTYPLRAFVPPAELAAWRAGKTTIINDIERELPDGTPEAAVLKAGAAAQQISAFMAVGLSQKGKWKAYFAVADSRPRAWTAGEIDLVQELAGQLLPRIERARAEEALRQSEEKYRTLFDTIEEGLTVFGIIRDDAGQLIDLRYQALNRAMQQQTGLPPQTILGRRLSEVLPPADWDRWMPNLAQVLASGEPITFEEHVELIDRWYLVSFYPRSGEEIASFYRDITDRKRQERHQRYLLALSDALRPLADAAEIQRITCQLLGEELKADRVMYADVEGDDLVLNENYVSERAQKWVGRFPFAAFGESVKTLQKGQTVIVDDVNLTAYEAREKEAFFAVGVYAVLAIPLIKNGQFVGDLSIHQQTPRHWREDEIALVRETAERIWAAVERAKAQEAWRASQQRFESIANLVPDLLWDSNPDGSINWYNQRWLDYTGQRLEEATGWGWMEAIHPDDRDASARRYQEAVGTGTLLRQEHQIRRHDGVYRWFAISASPLKDARGQVVNMYGAATDIHENKLAEEALQKLEQRNRLAIEAAQLATWEWDLVSDQVYWNEQHFHLLGMSVAPCPLPAQAFLDHLHPEDTASIQTQLRQAITQRTLYDAEFRIVRDDGVVRWMSGYGRVMGEQDGQPVLVSGVMVDITDRKQAEEGLKEADRRKDEFLAMLAHELRNPMSTLRSGLHILDLTIKEEMGLGATVAPTVEMMSRQTDHLVRMVDDLLDVSRISRGKIELKMGRVDLVDLARQAQQSLSSQFEQQGKVLHTLLPTLPIELEGDATRLTQVITNLLTNGLRYSGEQGQVWLSLEHKGQEAILQVRDNGIGLARDQLSAIFELFVQMDNSTARSKGGLGLGLTLVKRLVEMHGGRVAAQSEGIGNGSTFTVRLPTLTSATASTPKTAPPAPDSASAHRILVIDDNADAGFTLAMLLKLKGYETHTRNSGRAGIEAAESLQPAAILLDIGMPVMDGFETCRAIRHQSWGQALVVIALTGYGQEEDRQRTTEAGFNGHLVKPVDLETLTNLLSDLLSKD